MSVGTFDDPSDLIDLFVECDLGFVEFASDGLLDRGPGFGASSVLWSSTPAAVLSEIDSGKSTLSKAPSFSIATR